MKKNGLTHIRKWFWIYLLLVIMTNLAAYIAVYHQISDKIASPVPAVEIDNSARSNAGNPFPGEFRLRMILLLSAGLITIFFLSFIWLRMAVRHLERPVRSIQNAVFRLAQGKLNETVDIESADEFGRIGAGINELAANLQELLLYIWKQTGQCMVAIEHIRGLPEFQTDGQVSSAADERLRELTAAIESLREMAKSYVFYDVCLDGEKTLAINQPGPKEIADASK